jgi:signal peptidase II
VFGLLWFVAATPAQKRLQLSVLSLIFAGAIGNLYDNFTRSDADPARSVRDFLFFSGKWPVEWGFPAFNVADSCITVGAFGLLLMMVQEDRAAQKAKKKVSS